MKFFTGCYKKHINYKRGAVAFSLQPPQGRIPFIRTLACGRAQVHTLLGDQAKMLRNVYALYYNAQSRSAFTNSYATCMKEIYHMTI